MERKLASLQRVRAITPIDGADAIEAAHINGWVCVVKKGEFAVGDLGIYFEIDAIPPDEEPYRFLWTPRGEQPRAGTRPPKYRIRTMRLRGCLSQGLLMPLSAAPQVQGLDEGADVTELLGVGKYEPPLPAGMGDARCAFPSLLPKTDEIRVQSAPGVLDEIAGQPYVATLKCDGTSSTFLIHPDDGSFHACGRNWSILPGPNAYWSVSQMYDLEVKLKELDGRFAIQGEICGPGIMGNKLGLPKLDLFVFNVYDLVERRYLNDAAMRSLCDDLDLRPVPVVETGDRFAYDLDALLTLAEGKYEGTKNEREGIVIRPTEEKFSATLGGRLSFKVISNRYLLKEKD